MSIRSHITRIADSVEDIKAAIAEKGGIVPEGALVEDLADIIRGLGVTPPQVETTTATFTANGLYSQWHGTASRYSSSLAQQRYFPNNEASKRKTVGVIDIQSLAGVDWSAKTIVSITLKCTPGTSITSTRLLKFYRSLKTTYTNSAGELYLDTEHGVCQVPFTGTSGAVSEIVLDSSQLAWFEAYLKTNPTMLTIYLAEDDNTNFISLSAFAMDIEYADAS